MNLGLLRRSLRETRGLTWLCGAAIALFELLLAVLLPILAEDFSEAFFRTRISRFFLSALLGTEVTEIGPNLLTALAWTHPVVLTIFFAHAITFASRVPAAEVDQGTIDQLLALPVTRRAVFLAEAAGHALSATALVLFALAGSLVGSFLARAGNAPGAAELAPVALNLWLLGCAVAAVTWIFSARAKRRGRAVAWPIGILLASSLLNFLAALWAPARSLSFLSLLGYYEPMRLLALGNWPWHDLAALLGLTLVAGGIACWSFEQRDC